jgi:hypothetical protein
VVQTSKTAYRTLALIRGIHRAKRYQKHAPYVPSSIG